MPAGSGPQGKLFLSHPDNAQTTAAAIVVEEVEEVLRTLAQQARVDNAAVVKAASANVIEAGNTLWTALARCGIVAVARSFE